MADEKKPEPLTDEGIEGLVNLVETAAVLGTVLHVPVGEALRILLKTWQVVQAREQAGKLGAFGDVLSKTKH